MNLSEKKLQELKEKKLSIEDLNDLYFIASYRVEAENIENVLKLLNNNICSFKEIVDKFKSIKDSDDDPCLCRLLDEELFKKLIENNKLNTEDLRYLLNRLDRDYELDHLNEDTFVLKYIVDKGLFKELVDKFKNIKNRHNDPCLYKLLWNEELISNKKLNTDDLKYLLNRIDNKYELSKLCQNVSVIKYVLNEFVLDKETVDKFSEILESDDWYKNRGIYTIFDWSEYHNKNNEEILKLNELNRKICLLSSFDLNEDERLELIEVLKNNEIARNRLIQIVENNLEDQYDFENLKRILIKDTEKNLKTRFNF